MGIPSDTRWSVKYLWFVCNVKQEPGYYFIKISPHSLLNYNGIICSCRLVCWGKLLDPKENKAYNTDINISYTVYNNNFE